MTIFEIINPSDHLTIQADNPVAAAVPILVIGEGRLGLRSLATDETVLPVMLFGGLDDWLADHGFADVAALWAWTAEHWREVVSAMESVVVGDGDSRKLLELELESIEDGAKREHRIAFNDARRSSLNNIAGLLMQNADRYREFYEAKEAASKSAPAGAEQ